MSLQSVEGNDSYQYRPINTYSGRGTTKSGLKAENHAVIYIGQRPGLLQGERGITKRAIEVVPARPEIKLNAASRVDFGTVQTVQHNVVVCEVGIVSERSMPYLQEYWNDAIN